MSDRKVYKFFLQILIRGCHNEVYERCEGEDGFNEAPMSWLAP